MFSRDSESIIKQSHPRVCVEMQINGNIKCSGNLVLKGKVKGNIECDHINISSEGFLKGNINPKRYFRGDFEGDVFADTLAIESTANIKGNLHYNTLRLREVQNLMYS